MASAITLILAAACAPPPPPPPALPTLHIDAARITVSGLSSGAYMAHQLHLAYSDRIAGAALLAGGPYGCAQGDLRVALAQCTAPEDATLPALAPLVADVQARANDGRLAPLAGLKGDRVWVYHGAVDTIVSGPVSAAAADVYEALGAGVSITRNFDLPYAHLLPTGSPGDDCSKSEAPYIARCGFDAAGEVFKTLYNTAQPADQVTGELRAFDQRPYATDPESPPGADSGFVYVPAACTANEACGLHIALHGCEQSSQVIGDMFASRGGFNRWADAAKVIVLYPQAQSSLSPLNPKGCWDWWGYTGPDFDTRDGAQLRWIARMVEGLGGKLVE
ncbi:MAG: extracellular catalytic domain type 2 short-chain-length polyhydroxyalkanoate depolymerase [Pseudomarimonas sp.]